MLLFRTRVAFCGALALAMLLLASPAFAAPTNPSGLPLPRFASTRSNPVNVRVGPGTKYDIAWVYVKPGLPVEIIQEFDTWRKIRGPDMQQGWVHQSLLSGNRVGYVAPRRRGEKFPLKSRAAADARIRAWLLSGHRVKIAKCDGSWCQVTAVDHTDVDRPATYTGYLAQTDLWGVYKGETFD